MVRLLSTYKLRITCKLRNLNYDNKIYSDEIMRNFKSYIDELKMKLRLESDYKVAQFLDVPRQSMTKVNNGDVLGKTKCMRIAQALKRDPIEIIATAEAEKEKDKELKAIWIKLAKEKGNIDEWASKETTG